MIKNATALENVRFKDFTGHLEFDAGTYTIDIVPVGATDPAISGEFTLEDGSGTGFILQPMPSQDRLVGTWYTHDEAGNPMFLTFDSCVGDANGMGEFECTKPGASTAKRRNGTRPGG